MEKKFIEMDGIKYQVYICPKCGAELKFKMAKEKRRVHAMCKKCLKEIEVEVDSL